MLNKSQISPILAVLYIITSVTGICLFFHIHGKMIIVLHEWLGIIFVIISILHIMLNWKIFAAYFKKTTGAAMIGLALFISLIIAVWSGNPNKKNYNYSDHDKKIPRQEYSEHNY